MRARVLAAAAALILSSAGSPARADHDLGSSYDSTDDDILVLGVTGGLFSGASLIANAVFIGLNVTEPTSHPTYQFIGYLVGGLGIVAGAGTCVGALLIDDDLDGDDGTVPLFILGAVSALAGAGGIWAAYYNSTAPGVARGPVHVAPMLTARGDGGVQLFGTF